MINPIFDFTINYCNVYNYDNYVLYKYAEVNY